MAGTLTIGTLSDGTNSTSSTNAIMGSAKAWVNFNGATAGIRSSYNISSVTRNSAGNYTLNFSTSMQDANYAVLAIENDYTQGTSALGPQFSSANTYTSKTASQVRMVLYSFDYTDVNVAIFR